MKRMVARRLLLSILSLLVTALVFSGGALASGGDYVFQGGTPSEQQTVTNGLNASSFNWSLVPQQITIVIAPTAVDNSVPGTINLDPSLLDSGEFSWGVVQNEYANQVGFFLLPQGSEAAFSAALGGTVWCRDDQTGLSTAQYGCERFASTLAWAYWQDPQNCIRPDATGGISGSMTPAAFRALLATTLGTVTETARPAVRAFATTTFHSSSAILGPKIAPIRAVASARKPIR